MPHFSLGSATQVSGYQRGTQIQTPSLAATAGYNLQADANQLGKNQFGNVMSSFGSAVPNVMGALGQYTSTTAANSANLGTAISRGLVDSTGKVMLGGATPGAEATAARVAESLGEGATKSGMSALGASMSIAGAAYGAYNIANAATSYADNLGAGQMQDMAGKSTEQKHGVQYQRYGGIDTSAIDNYTHQQNVASDINMVGSGAGFGASVGSLAGPVGTAIGAGIGALGGWIGSLFGRKSRKERVEQQKKLAQANIAGMNAQAESDAGTQGIKNEFYGTHGQSLSADKGKPVFSTGKETDGIMSKNETIVHTEEPDILHRYDYPGSKDLNKKDTHDEDVYAKGINTPETGIIGEPDMAPWLADMVAPAAKMMKQIQEEATKIENGKGNQKTKDVNLNNLRKKAAPYAQQIEEAMNIQNRLTGSNVMQASCGKAVRKFATGKRGLMSPIAGIGVGLPYLMAEKNFVDAQQPYAFNAYVTDPLSTRALDLMGSLRHDPNAELKQLSDAAVANRYGINRASGLSRGQKMAMSNAAINQLAAQKIGVMQNAAEMNNKYKQALAQQMSTVGRDAATRQQQANENYYKHLQEAYGAKWNNKLANMKHWLQVGQQNIQDWNTNQYQNRMLDLYDAQIKANAAKQRGGGTPTSKSTASATSSGPVYSTPSGLKTRDQLADIMQVDMTTPVQWPSAPRVVQQNTPVQQSVPNSIQEIINRRQSAQPQTVGAYPSFLDVISNNGISEILKPTYASNYASQFYNPSLNTYTPNNFLKYMQ